MIISRTPYRISFFGGGTDYPAWYGEHRGAVLATSIDKFCYISCRKLPPFFEHRHRIVYSKTELVRDIENIQHPAVRESFRFMNITAGVEIHHDGDLPARTGVGSSSAFTVGLLHALHALQGKMINKKQLALEAIHVEQDMILESVGSQDQVIAAFGGFNKVEFWGEHNIEVTPVTIPKSRLESFHSHLLLFFTGLSRTASEVAQDKILQIPNKKSELNSLYSMVGDALGILNSSGDMDDFGKLLHESWNLKKSLSTKVTNDNIDSIYSAAMNAGAIGGKLLGAGGGGFILFFVPPERHSSIKQALSSLLYVPFKFDTLGSQIIYYSGDEL